MEKLWFHNDFDIKWYKMEGTRLGIGRGDQQQVRQPWAFLARAFFSEITRPFSKKTSWVSPTRGINRGGKNLGKTQAQDANQKTRKGAAAHVVK